MLERRDWENGENVARLPALRAGPLPWERMEKMLAPDGQAGAPSPVSIARAGRVPCKKKQIIATPSLPCAPPALDPPLVQAVEPDGAVVLRQRRSDGQCALQRVARLQHAIAMPSRTMMSCSGVGALGARAMVPVSAGLLPATLVR